ncbi:MAG: PrsW family glutamic-type intramembrane protease [Pyrinomonadaceae bacterium]
MKLAITVRSGSLAGKTLEISDGFLTIGRGAACGLMFDPLREREVSSKHGYIETKPDGFYLVDNNSTNGTFVNGERVQKAKLKNGDSIQFGKNGPQAVAAIENEQAINYSPAANEIRPSSNFQPPNNQQFQAPPNQPQNWRNSMANVGLRNPEIKPVQSSSRKYLGAAVAIFGIVFFGLIVTLMIIGNLGIVAAFIAAIVAFVPAVFYILPLLLIDRYDPEPPWALALAFAWGALVAVLISATVNDLFGAIFGQSIAGVISAPIFEEGTKGLGVVLVLIFLRREFDDILDGIVYAGTIALGFATVENVLYYGRGLLEGGSGLLVTLFVMRGLLSPFAHVTFTSMTGIGCGISRESHNKIVRVVMPILGYFCAVTLHAVWNTLAFLGGGAGFLIGYIVLEVPFFLIFVGFIGYVMHRQNKILKEMLAIDAARGLITPEQLKVSTSVFKSLTWLLSSAFTKKYKARRRFLRAVGKLGLSYWHIQRATAARGQTASFQQNPILREEVLAWRDKI